MGQGPQSSVGLIMTHYINDTYISSNMPKNICKLQMEAVI